MPIGPYFMYVGGVLLVLLFAADAYLPEPTTAPASKPETIEKLHIRIRSDHKWPEKVVFDIAADRSQYGHTAKHAKAPHGPWSRRFAEQGLKQ